jgi:hypothetical protein
MGVGPAMRTLGGGAGSETLVPLSRGVEALEGLFGAASSTMIIFQNENWSAKYLLTLLMHWECARERRTFLLSSR